MKKVLTGITSVALASMLLAGCGDGGGAAKEKLVISTWGFSEEFFNEQVYAPFEEEHNVDIVVEVGNNAERLNKIRQGTSQVDIVFLSDYYAQQGIAEGLFETIDRANIPNIEQIYDSAKAPLGEDYGPAYTVGQLGIAYNPNLIKNEVTSWSDLWSDEFAGNLTLPNITATAGPMVLDAASTVAGNTAFNEDAAFAELTKLKDGVVKFYSQTSEYVNMFAQEEIAGGPIMEMYFKDIQAAVPEAKFVTPSEGAYAVMNTVNVVKGSKNKELAEEFINWQLSEEVQTASAKAKVDSPVNVNVKLTEEEAEGITYGADVVDQLKLLDMEFVNNNAAVWTDRWNREIAN
ncbi:PotD/PotF family extracellular solute-binding protein [Paenibacillus shunpengii]|uniref:PotD/PotF family extracellular solute-binding protein n=1 Tax=Paenibacillus shunpengii TaxID=2054424 RepID=A0ABW5SVN4_9BACL|nr:MULTISPECIES: ABC transporter substrate-binding protein [unclassified Paenibacillus]OMC66379.1 spermidine/putrescine ABC transporter substrate-binding protein [Paenibacillus sp. FSL H7-0326]SDW87837.1 putative spermidine/putrescine transport system substrate-binding protein [Paenibacillus sp. PDC88]